MMKFLATIWFFLLPLPALAFEQADWCVQAEAQVRAYYEALGKGDVEAIRNQLGGQLAEKRRHLLTNPTYPEYLIQTYSDRKAEINDCAPGNSDTVRVRVTETSFGPSTDSVEKLFVLVRQAPTGDYLIVSEGLALYD